MEVVAENDKQTLEVHETIWSETLEDGTSPEIHEIAGSLESAANLLLKLCPQNEMEKHGKSNEIKRQRETDTCRAIWDIVEEIHRDWKIWPTAETVSTSVNGILGASHEFWDEDEEEDGPRSFASRSRTGLRSSRTSSLCIFSDTVVRGVCEENPT